MSTAINVQQNITMIHMGKSIMFHYEHRDAGSNHTHIWSHDDCPIYFSFKLNGWPKKDTIMDVVRIYIQAYRIGFSDGKAKIVGGIRNLLEIKEYMPHGKHMGEY